MYRCGGAAGARSVAGRRARPSQGDRAGTSDERGERRAGRRAPPTRVTRQTDGRATGGAGQRQRAASGAGRGRGRGNKERTAAPPTLATGAAQTQATATKANGAGEDTAAAATDDRRRTKRGSTAMHTTCDQRRKRINVGRGDTEHGTGQRRKGRGRGSGGTKTDTVPSSRGPRAAHAADRESRATRAGSNLVRRRSQRVKLME